MPPGRVKCIHVACGSIHSFSPKVATKNISCALLSSATLAHRLPGESVGQDVLSGVLRSWPRHAFFENFPVASFNFLSASLPHDHSDSFSQTCVFETSSGSKVFTLRGVYLLDLLRRYN